MNNEKMNQMIDEAYENYITQTRIEFEKWYENNPDVLVNYREDTKELFLKSIKEDKHWFTGEKGFSEKWGLRIEERELSLEERKKLYEKEYAYTEVPNDHWLNSKLTTRNIPTRLITITYNTIKTEIYE